MSELTFLIIVGVLVGLNVFTLLLHQHERHRGMERELVLVKALAADNLQELQYAQESPADNRKRMTIENDLAGKAEKIEEWKAERAEREGAVDGIKPGSPQDHVRVS